MELFRLGFISIGLLDLLDIVLVASIFYYLFTIMRGTYAAQMLVGLLFLLVASTVAQLVRLEALSWLVAKVQTVWVIAFVILFQPELRRVLLHLGQNRLIRMFYRGGRNKVLDEVVKAASILSERGYGALIVLARNTGLAPVIETGIPVRAEVSAPLLVSIFTPRSPLHDGAVVIQDVIVEAAKCVLPLSENPNIDPSLGTRHRAALGLSEVSDAVIVVVSEETQAISLAVGGVLDIGLTPARLRARLGQLFGMPG
ncbi:MAG: TIGR00159 family protein [Candidatus Latescibacterota bacterium]|nr:MAG: TIGR00159 family protein [Candidatus Latescibacterota bacterium]